MFHKVISYASNAICSLKHNST